MTDSDSRHQLGIPEMDAQHHYLYRIFDRIEDAPTVSDREATGRLLGELENYLLFHFTSEEYFMRMYKAPEFAVHQTDHEQAGDRVVKFIDDFEHDRLNPQQLRIFLTGWLMEHSETADERYAKFVRELRGRGQNAKPGTTA